MQVSCPYSRVLVISIQIPTARKVEFDILGLLLPRQLEPHPANSLFIDEAGKASCRPCFNKQRAELSENHAYTEGFSLSTKVLAYFSFFGEYYCAGIARAGSRAMRVCDVIGDVVFCILREHVASQK